MRKSSCTDCASLEECFSEVLPVGLGPIQEILQEHRCYLPNPIKKIIAQPAFFQLLNDHYVVCASH